MAQDRPLSSDEMIRRAREQLNEPPSKSTHPMPESGPDAAVDDEEIRALIQPATQRDAYRPRPVPQDPFADRTMTRKRRQGANPAIALVVAGSLLILGLALFLSFASTTVGP